MNDPSLDQILNRWIYRRRVQRSLAWSGAGLLAGCVILTLLGISAALTQRLLAEEYLTWGFTALLAAWFGAAAAGFAWPIHRMAAARQFDLQLGLSERVSTALEARESENPLQALQLEDSIAHALQANYRGRIPLRLPLRLLGAALVLILANAAFWYYGKPVFSTAAQNRTITDAIREEAAQVEDLIEAIRSNPDLTETQKDRLTEPLTEALDALQEARTLEEAFSAVEKAQEQLKTLEDPGALALADSLRDSGQSLSEGSDSALQGAAQGLAQGDLQAAADALRGIDTESLSQTDLQNLAEDLGNLADSIGPQDSALADQLEEAATAAQAGNAQAAQEALSQAAASLEALDQQTAAAQAAAQAGQSLEGGQEELLQAGQPAGESQASSSGGQSDGQSGEQGQGANSGAGEGSGNSNSQSGSEAGNEAIGQGNNPDGSGESSFQPITPSGIGGEGSDWIAIPPSGLPGDNITGTGPSNPGDPAPLTVPYSEVFSQYQDAVNQAIDSGQVPTQYRDLVREYFTALEP